jgi:hypothetical protein
MPASVEDYTDTRPAVALAPPARAPAQPLMRLAVTWAAEAMGVSLKRKWLKEGWLAGES